MLFYIFLSFLLECQYSIRQNQGIIYSASSDFVKDQSVVCVHTFF